MASIAGVKIGVNTRMTTMGSTNMQATKKAIQIAIRTPVGPASLIPTASRIICGIWAKEIIHEKPLPTATRINTTAVIKPVDFAMA